MNDIPLRWISIHELANHDLRTSLPVGSVKFVHEAMRLASVKKPENLSYPKSLEKYLHRKVQKQKIKNVPWRCFMKSIETKGFTGSIFELVSDPTEITEYYQFKSDDGIIFLEADKNVWISEIVEWVNEARYYILDGKILGYGFYGEYSDNAPQPDLNVIKEMVSAHSDSPIAYALDVGVLSTGQTALVECNDAWSIGYYKGNLSALDYFRFLSSRWEELLIQ
jgi:hypothetical protein